MRDFTLVTDPTSATASAGEAPCAAIAPPALSSVVVAVVATVVSPPHAVVVR